MQGAIAYMLLTENILQGIASFLLFYVSKKDYYAILFDLPLDFTSDDLS